MILIEILSSIEPNRLIESCAILKIILCEFLQNSDWWNRVKLRLPKSTVVLPIGNLYTRWQNSISPIRIFLKLTLIQNQWFHSEIQPEFNFFWLFSVAKSHQKAIKKSLILKWIFIWVFNQLHLSEWNSNLVHCETDHHKLNMSAAPPIFKTWYDLQAFYTAVQIDLCLKMVSIWLIQDHQSFLYERLDLFTLFKTYRTIFQYVKFIGSFLLIKWILTI